MKSALAVRLSRLNSKAISLSIPGLLSSGKTDSSGIVPETTFRDNEEKKIQK
jgi:hypothetical protein